MVRLEKQSAFERSFPQKLEYQMKKNINLLEYYSFSFLQLYFFYNNIVIIVIVGIFLQILLTSILSFFFMT